MEKIYRVKVLIDIEEDSIYKNDEMYAIEDEFSSNCYLLCDSTDFSFCYQVEKSDVEILYELE